MAIDPRNLKPADLARLLNSTPLGTVLDERQLYRHRMRAGFRIGDGRRVDLFRYVAWLIEELAKPKVEKVRDYEAVKEAAAARNRALSEAGRDIGELPAVVDPERREKAGGDFRFFYDETSAVQHAMNLKLQDEAAFFAEYQNEPLPEKAAEDEGLLSADQIAQKTNGMKRAEVPIGASRLTAFVDVQGKLLFFAVVAWEDDFTGYVLEYGAYPDQRRPYFTLRDAQRTLQWAAKGAGLEGAIYAGLETLAGELLGREWRRDDGAHLKIERCLVDANWGTSTDVVYQFCRQSTHAAVLLPSHGRFVGASSIPFSEYRRKRGDRVGLNWRIPNVRAIEDAAVVTGSVYSELTARVQKTIPICCNWGRHPDSSLHEPL